jgi:tyrosinase
MTFTNNFYHPDGSSYSPKVSDLFVPENLGYTYGLAAPPASAAASPNLVALRQSLSTIRKTPAAPAANVKTFSATAAGQAGGAGKPLTVSVNVDPGLIASVVARRPVPSGAEFLNFAAAREQHASGPRVLGFLRDVSVTQPQDTIYRVFLDHPGLTAAVPITDPSYVGSFGIFVHREGGHGRHGQDVKPSFVFDLTTAVQQVFSTGAPPAKALNLQILPVPNRPNAIVGTIVSSRAEIAFVNA